MLFKFQYIEETERQSILNENIDKCLIEDQRLLDGNFLIFSDIKPLENQVSDIQTDQQAIKDGMADLYIAIASIPGMVL